MNFVRMCCNLRTDAAFDEAARGNDGGAHDVDALNSCAEVTGKANAGTSAPVRGSAMIASMLHEVLSEKAGDAVVVQHVAAALAVPKGAIEDVQG